MNVYTRFLPPKNLSNRNVHMNFISQKVVELNLKSNYILKNDLNTKELEMPILEIDKKSKQENESYGFHFKNKNHKNITVNNAKNEFANIRNKIMQKSVFNFERISRRESDVQNKKVTSLNRNLNTTGFKIDKTTETPKNWGFLKTTSSINKNAIKKCFIFLNNKETVQTVPLKIENSKTEFSGCHSQLVTRSRNFEVGNTKLANLLGKEIGEKDSGSMNLLAKLNSGSSKPRIGLEPRKLEGDLSQEENRLRGMTSRDKQTTKTEDYSKIQMDQIRTTNSPKQLKMQEIILKIFTFTKNEKFELLIEFLENLRTNETGINWNNVINSREIHSERSLVHMAVIHKQVNLLNYLLVNRADFHIRDKEGVIPLMIVGSEQWLDGEDLVIENTHDVNIQDRAGNTALHIAVAKSNVKFVVKLLVCRNVNVRQTNAENMKPLDLAEVHLVVKLQGIFRNYEKNKGENANLNNSNRVSNILAKNGGRPIKELFLHQKRKVFLGKGEAMTPRTREHFEIGSVTVKNEGRCSLGNEQWKQSIEDPKTLKISVNLSSRLQNCPILDIYQKNKNEATTSGKQLILLNAKHEVVTNQNLGGMNNLKKLLALKESSKTGLFLKKKSEKILAVKFKKINREGKSQKRFSNFGRKKSMQKNGNKDISRNILDKKEPENFDNIEIEILGGKKKELGVKTFLKMRGLAVIKERKEQTELVWLGKQKPGLNDFIIHSIIGKGSFGEVYLVQKKGTTKFFAMKTLPKKRIIKENLTRYALTERNVLSTISHPFIVKLRYAFQNNKTLFLIMDYLPGGDLGKYLQDEVHISESKARIFAAEIILAISELHQRDIIFRDLKPENVLLDKDGHAMLSDFGLSKENVFSENKEKSFCGSVAYLAPEMLKKTGHGKPMDWYLVGVIIYEMVVGIPPFFAETKEELFNNIEHSSVKFPHSVSGFLKDLLCKLFEKDPFKRIKEEEIKTHFWFKGINWEEALLKKLKPPRPFIKKIRMNQLGDVMPDIGNENLSVENLKGWTFIEEIEEKKRVSESNLFGI